MPKITYILRDRSARVVDVPIGLSVMEGARQNDVPGIVANCGGGCACATCHAYIREDWFALLPHVDEMEDEMLNFAFERDVKRSRLTCQIVVSEALDGLVVEVPERQA